MEGVACDFNFRDFFVVATVASPTPLLCSLVLAMASESEGEVKASSGAGESRQESAAHTSPEGITATAAAAALQKLSSSKPSHLS